MTWSRRLNLGADDPHVLERGLHARPGIPRRRPRCRRRPPRRPPPAAPDQLLLQQLEVDGHRVQRVLHLVRDARRQPAERDELARVAAQRRLAIGALGLRRLRAARLGPVGRQLGADGVEEAPQLAELVLLGQVEPHVELAAAETREPAPDDVNRPQDQLRERRRDDDGDERAPRGWRAPTSRSSTFSSRRTSSVDTPMRIVPNFSLPSRSGLRTSSVAAPDE